jgi:Flp pilus assembly protein TadG
MVSLSNVKSLGERGQAIVELALTLPLLLLIIIGVFDFGLMFQRYELVTNAARELARVAILPDYTLGQAREHAKNYLTAGGLPGSSAVDIADCAGTGTAGTVCVSVRKDTATVSTSPAKTIDIVVASVSYDHSHGMVGAMMQLFGGSMGTVRLRAISKMRVE